MDMKETSSWSNLPQCLLELILERLILPDRLRFGSVCHSWRTAQAQSLHLPVSRLPFLVFRRGSSSIEFFSLTEKKIYKMPMPKCETPMSHLHCVSSSHGWLMFISTKKNETGFLFNPFIKKCVRLPNKKIGFLGLDCIFFSTPTDPDGIFHIMQGCQRLMLCSLKDPSQWSIFDESEQGNVVSNTIFCDGKLYALNDDWSLAIIDPLFPHNITNVKMEDLRHFPRIPRLRVPNRPDQEYILVESSGEILIAKIIRHGLRNLTCEIFRADLPKMKWVRVENLGDRMLLLTKTTSISICASEIGCKGNRIYYILTLCNSYVEFELGSKEMTTHSIPVDDDDARICEWLTTDRINLWMDEHCQSFNHQENENPLQRLDLFGSSIRWMEGLVCAIVLKALLLWKGPQAKCKKDKKSSNVRGQVNLEEIQEGLKKKQKKTKLNEEGPKRAIT